ncbi:hypothetical protein PR048_021091 [Dryococelus australis]|uniref:PiggyBac transposable element-derived protein domain-containing protein n=1 Tax=Dryococelus australis TaxID=614101 RepID=A0ABQ9GX88_9NEOP|nr:hypothetical protein PR048_021091 [Dryococelus australis]
MANKPDKFGIKFWIAADVDSKYLFSGFRYHRKENDQPSDQILGLLEPYLQCGRNVTMDNFFTFLKLSRLLNDKKTSLLGTVNGTRSEVPPTAKNFKQQLYATYVYKHKDTTLTVYQGKVNKNVILLSLLHPSVNIAENEKKTPDTIQYYNTTKFIVYIIDQVPRKYSIKNRQSSGLFMFSSMC